MERADTQKHSKTLYSIAHFTEIMTFVRPADMFCETLEREGKTVKRFTYSKASEDILLHDKEALTSLK